MKTAGIVIMIFGLALTIFTTVTFFTREKVVDIGKVEITREKPHHLYWSPLAGLAVIGIGGIVFWRGTRQ
jgi:hypothetical protein